MSKNVPKQGALTVAGMRHEAQATTELEDTERSLWVFAFTGASSFYPQIAKLKFHLKFTNARSVKNLSKNV